MMTMNNEEILEEFYCQYFRSPNKDEFIACGGDMKECLRVYRNYSAFLRLNNYPRIMMNNETFEVYDTRVKEVIFTGVLSEVAEELHITYKTIKYYYDKNKLFDDRFEIRHKPFKGHL